MVVKNKNQVKIANRSDLFKNESSDEGEEFNEVDQNQLDKLMQSSLFQLNDTQPEQEHIESIIDNETDEQVEETSEPMAFKLFSNLPPQVISTKAQELTNPIQQKTIEDYTYEPTEDQMNEFNSMAIEYDQIIEESKQLWETKQYNKRVITINLKTVNTPQSTRPKKSQKKGKEIDINLPSPYLAKKLFKPSFKVRKVNRVHLKF